MASSRDWGWVFCAAALAACSVGHGDGEIDGVVAIEGCRREGAYQLRPTAFFAEAAEQVLKIRIQRGSDIEVRSDGVSVLVEDATLLRREFLDHEIAVVPNGDSRAEQPRVGVTLYLNESCPAERDRTPVVLAGVSGSVRFTNIYAPEVDDDDVRITAELLGVRFEDPRDLGRWAVLDGRFDFLYVRGSPAQRFP